MSKNVFLSYYPPNQYHPPTPQGFGNLEGILILTRVSFINPDRVWKPVRIKGKI